MHLIALKISQKCGLPWVADFRDPWTEIDFYEDLMLSARADRKHHALEREVLQSANVITVVSKQMKEQFEILGASNVIVIPNGYDTDDFDIQDDIAWLKKTGSRFTITHLGSIVPSRNPVSFWKVIKRLVERDQDFARDLLLILAGKVDYSIKKAIDANHLEKWVKEIDYMPHKNAISLLKKSQVLLLLINNTANSRGILTGKFFEYLNARRPILAIGPTDGEVSSVLDETSTGRMIDFQDENTMEQCILEYYGLYKNKKLHINARNIEKYSRRNLTREMSTIFNELTKAL
jgi:glycosyltransferase involved in cell wall biosynthesis